jgi:hypothetical protein
MPLQPIYPMLFCFSSTWNCVIKVKEAWIPVELGWHFDFILKFLNQRQPSFTCWGSNIDNCLDILYVLCCTQACSKRLILIDQFWSVQTMYVLRMMDKDLYNIYINYIFNSGGNLLSSHDIDFLFFFFLFNFIFSVVGVISQEFHPDPDFDIVWQINLIQHT